MTIAKRQHGFAAIAAVFLLVVLAALGSYMVSFSNTQHLTAAQDIQGSRAYWAARAGLEWAIASIVAAPAACPAAPAPFVVNTGADFTLTITCTRTEYTDSGTIAMFQITSVAASGTVGSIGYIERSVSASLER
jgi:MSHA biogenesis protein MshP